MSAVTKEIVILVYKCFSRLIKKEKRNSNINKI